MVVPKGVHTKWVGFVCPVSIVVPYVFLSDVSLDDALRSFALRLKISYHHPLLCSIEVEQIKKAGGEYLGTIEKSRDQNVVAIMTPALSSGDFGDSEKRNSCSMMVVIGLSQLVHWC